MLTNPYAVLYLWSGGFARQFLLAHAQPSLPLERDLERGNRDQLRYPGETASHPTFQWAYANGWLTSIRPSGQPNLASFGYQPNVNPRPTPSGADR